MYLCIKLNDETSNNVHYAPSQKEALQTAINSKIMLLTGGPGTGKARTIG
jgi:exodeoxyribonuclease V alpha subunit